MVFFKTFMTQIGILSPRLRKLYRVIFCHLAGGNLHAVLDLCILHKVILATGPSAHGLRWTKLCSLDLRWATSPNLAQLGLIVIETMSQRISSRGSGPLASSLHSAFKLVMLQSPAYSFCRPPEPRSSFLKDHATTEPLEAFWIMTVEAREGWGWSQLR